MNVGIIRLSEKPTVALVSNNQLVFVSTISSDNLLQEIYDALQFNIDELKVYIKPSIMSEIPDGTERLSTFRVGTLTKCCVVAEDDIMIIMDLASQLGVKSCSLYSCFSFYESLSNVNNSIILDSWLNSVYLCAYVENSCIKDVRRTTEHSLEITLNQMVNIYNTMDIIDINRLNYSNVLRQVFENFNEFDEDEIPYFSFIGYCMQAKADKELLCNTTENEKEYYEENLDDYVDNVDDNYIDDVESEYTKEYGRNNDSYYSPVNDDEYMSENYNSLEGNVEGFEDENYDFDDFDDYDSEFMDTGIPKNKKRVRGNARNKKIKNPTRNASRGRSPWLFWKDNRTSEEKREEQLRRELLGDYPVQEGPSRVRNIVTIIAGCLVGVMVLGVVFSTVYRGKVKYTNLELTNLSKQLDTKKDFKSSINIFSKDKTPVDKIERIQNLEVNGIIEEVKYRNGKCYITVYVKNDNDLENMNTELSSVGKVEDTMSLGIAPINNVDYTRYSIVLDVS